MQRTIFAAAVLCLGIALALGAALPCRAQNGGTVLPAGIAFDADGRVLLSIGATGSSASLDVGLVAFDASGAVLRRVAIASGAGATALTAAGIVTGDASVILGGSAAGSADADYLLARVAHPRAVSGADDVPRDVPSFALAPLYPNPLRPSQTLTASITLTTPARIRIVLYDASGRFLRMLRDEDAAPGAHAFAIPLDGLALGTYLLQCSAGTRMQTGRVLLLRE